MASAACTTSNLLRRGRFAKLTLEVGELLSSPLAPANAMAGADAIAGVAVAQIAAIAVAFKAVCIPTRLQDDWRMH